MPIYEYVCSDCDLKFELLRPFSQADEGTSCPRCHNGAERIVSTCASFSKNESGEVTALAGAGSSCGGCAATGCNTCGL